MVLDVVTEKRFYQCHEGKYWTENAFPYEFWLRYLEQFSEVVIVARVEKIATPEANWHRVTGQNVSIHPLPIYIGPTQLIKKLLPTLLQIRKRKSSEAKAVIYRIPGILSYLYHLVCKPKVYGAEVVGDPEDTFSENASASPLRRLIKGIFIKLLKKQCRGATSISYVTKSTLQRKYPPSNAAFATHYSSIKLREQDFVSSVPEPKKKPDFIELICIGNLSQPYKGCDFMLACLEQLNRGTRKYKLTWVGDGALLPSMKTLAEKLGVSSYVEFTGNISQRDEINRYIDKSDVFVLASRQEGLPRVMIEAMARAKVCVGTDVGGVRELIEAQFIVQRDDIQNMVAVIDSVSELNSDEIRQISKRNLEESLSYSEAQLSKRRQLMYENLRNRSGE